MDQCSALSSLPFYYRKLPGNMPDVKTVRHLLGDLDQLGFSKVKLVMDRFCITALRRNAKMASLLSALCLSR